MRVIFLDIDGVLNSRRSALAMNGYGYLPMGSMTPRQLKDQAKLDPIAIKLLVKLVKKTGAKIVISSSWRYKSEAQSIEVFNSLFGTYGLSDTVIGSTPHDITGFRGVEIEKWLNGHPEVTDYIILDDDEDMLDTQLHNFIQTDMMVGFGLTEYEDILARWNVPDVALA